MTQIGTIVQIRRETAGSGLAAAASPGDLSLTVDWAIDFTQGERRLLMIGTPDSDNETLAYTAVDDDTEALTIEPPGVVLPWDAGDPVTPLDPTGMPEETWYIDVDMGDGGNPVACTPSHALQDKLREDEEYVGVRCKVDGAEVVTLIDKAVSTDPGSIQAPLFVAHLASNQSFPNGSSFTTVSAWIVTELRGGMQYNSGSVIVPVSGWYGVGNSALLWEPDPTGRRAVQPSYGTDGGTVPGGLVNVAGDGSVRQTTAVASPLKPLQAGDTVSLTASQTSGSALGLVGDADGAKSFFCVEYRGPL
jgi:hypothetical protein